MSTVVTFVPLQAEHVEEPTEDKPCSRIQCPWIRRTEVLQDDGSFRIPTWRPDNFYVEIFEALDPSRHGHLHRLLRADVDWHLVPRPPLPSQQVEPLRRHTDAASSLLQHGWRMAPWISLHDGLLSSQHLEIPRLFEEGAESDWREDRSAPDETAPCQTGEKVDPVRRAVEEDDRRFW